MDLKVWKVTRPYVNTMTANEAIVVAATAEEARFIFYEDDDFEDFCGDLHEYEATLVDLEKRGIVRLYFEG